MSGNGGAGNVDGAGAVNLVAGANRRRIRSRGCGHLSIVGDVDGATACRLITRADGCRIGAALGSHRTVGNADGAGAAFVTAADARAGKVRLEPLY